MSSLAAHNSAQGRERGSQPQQAPQSSANLAPPALAGMLESLERILAAQLEGQRRLLGCFERKRDAIAAADIQVITQACAQEHLIIQKLGELEKHRLSLIGDITQSLASQALAPLTLSQIAHAAPEPRQSRLIVLAAELREALASARRQSSIVRSAAEALSRHMAGIVQTVHSALSKARVYGSKGTLALGAQVSSTVDVKS